MELYLQERQSLIAQEKALRFDANRVASASSLEKQADEKLRSVRASEAASIWGKEEEGDLFPGMHFLTSKETIEKTKVFQTLQQMPKGAILHCHLDAMCPASFLLDQALLHPSIHVRCPLGPLPTSGPFPSWPYEALLQFKAMPLSFTSETPGIFEHTYDGGWIPLQQVRKEYPGGGKEFDKRVLGLLTIEPGESYAKYDTSDKIWKKFGSTFLVSEGMLMYEPIFRAYLRKLFHTVIADGVSWVETRINFLNATMVSAQGEDNLDHLEWVRIYNEVLEDVKLEMKVCGKEDSFWGATIIYTTIRFISNDVLRTGLEDCIRLKKAFPSLISGFDLVGHEDSLRPLKDYLPELLWFKERQKEEGLEIPYVFHAGETLGDGTVTDCNLFDALLLGTKRIGHGFSLAKHPLLMKLCKERDVAIEVCPISNEILRYTPSILNHPLQILLNNSVPVALSCDDPQIFGNLGMSYDFFQVFVASESTSLLSLAVLAEQSIKYSLMEENHKKACLEIWKRRWNAYIEKVARM